MVKYIIKNCIAFNSCRNWCRDKQKPCQDCNDCIMKQIVGLCDNNMNRLLYDGETMKLKFVEANSLAREIFDILEIEETEEG